jgi:hypothetical protein
MYMSLILSLVVFGGGAISTFLAINGVIPGTLASSVIGLGVWLGGVIGLAFLLALIFVRSMALSSALRAENGVQARK